MSINKTVTVDKFLGLHQSEDGSTERRPGESDVMENFYITDGYNLKLRPGVSADLMDLTKDFTPRGKIHSMHKVVLQGFSEILIFYEDADDSSSLRMALVNTKTRHWIYWTSDQTKLRSDKPVKVFLQGNDTYVAGSFYGSANDYSVQSFRIHHTDDQNANIDSHLYTPVYLTGCALSGGGTELEPLNILNDHFKVEYSSDGSESQHYLLPEVAEDIEEVWVDGEKKVDADGNYWGHVSGGVWYPPEDIPAGVNNVVLVCFYRDEFLAAREKFINMRHCESYNGATDSRVFFYGDGSDICFYSGMPAFGAGLYIPVANEIKVGNSSGSITAMRRHGSKLMAFLQNSTYTIDYTTVTLADGRIIPGYYVRDAHKAVGNDMDNQVQTVNNCPRTLCHGVLYDWKHNASYYQDERYAKPASQKVAIALRHADAAKIVTCDNDMERTYYMFLNDDRGTVLLHRYDLDVWCMYTGEVFQNVTCATVDNGRVYFCTGNSLLYLDGDHTYDDWYKPGQTGLSECPICARWESGYYDMGMYNRRKYSSYLWISMLPEANSRMDVTVKTDRRDNYITKTIGVPLLSWETMDFSNFSFLLSRAPRMKRIKLKAKKYVYYKLIFSVDHPGARATVLGYDQQVRFASEVK